VEEHNLPNQLLPIWVGDQDTLQWGKPTALFHLVYDLADISITIKNERYVDQPLGEIVIVAVDSLDVRRLIWAQVHGSQVVLPNSMDLMRLHVKRGEGETAEICSYF
jgi:hypothetical protein